ncbi:hypothetical protein [Brevifollis gellanilyticus]|uniref:Uncharacterized protein n=1 Tax=Brevifollis gellanilyticus TaxID=748831 RepID=A0A512M9F2_9BACT|nr:hypothetical protein [Brevifollis gellanilyticus]GEP43374.1 hypothetical protein BGE01nite_26650 [Brevifollis gellanilyticus]
MPDNTSSSDGVLPHGVIASRPWLWVVLAFLVLLSAWSTLFYIAYHNQPESVPLVKVAPVHP